MTRDCKPILTEPALASLESVERLEERWAALRWFVATQQNMVRAAAPLTARGVYATDEEIADRISGAASPPPDGLSPETVRHVLPVLRVEARDMTEAFYTAASERKRAAKKRKERYEQKETEGTEGTERTERTERTRGTEGEEGTQKSDFPLKTPFSEKSSQSDIHRASADAHARTTDDAQGLEDYEAAARIAGIQGDELRRFLAYNAGKGSIPPEEAVRRWTARRTATEAAGGPAAVSARRAALSARAAREREAQDADRRARASESNVAKILRIAEERGARTPEDLDAIGALPEVDAFFGEVIEAKRRWKELHP